MNRKEAEKILELAEVFEDKGCTCFQGNAPCSYCVDCPTEDMIEEAIKIIENDINGYKYAI